MAPFQNSKVGGPFDVVCIKNAYLETSCDISNLDQFSDPLDVEERYVSTLVGGEAKLTISASSRLFKPSVGSELVVEPGVTSDT